MADDVVDVVDADDANENHTYLITGLLRYLLTSNF